MSAAAERVCRVLGATIGPVCNAMPEGRWGFMLLLFQFGGGDASYISNAERPDMIKALREFADVLEHNEDDALHRRN